MRGTIETPNGQYLTNIVGAENTSGSLSTLYVPRSPNGDELAN